MRLSLPPVPTSAALLASALLLAGCAAGGRSAGASSGFSDVIEFEEIQESTATNAYDLVTQARPIWLRSRGTASLRGGPPPLPIVYIRTTRQGPVETLRGIATVTLQELRFVDAPTATMRYGNGHPGGVIEVTLRRR